MSDDEMTDPWKCPEPPPAIRLDKTLPSALEKLGPSPFAKNRFPFLGFLATVYDHIAAQACTRKPAPDCD